MISVVYCTKETKPEHKEHLIKSSGLHKHIEVIEIINNGESLTKSYNRGLKQAKYDIVVFCHDDLTIETKQWGPKLIKLFQKNPDHGIIGVAGTKNMPVSGQWWENRGKMYGRVAHTHEGKTWLSAYSEDLGQNLEDVVIVDGVWFAVEKNRIQEKFNETVVGYHFYEINFCFENYLKGVKIGVTTSIRINHKSIGQTNDQWEVNRAEFAEKYKDNLPVNVKKNLNKGQKLKLLFSSMSFSHGSDRDKIMLETAIKFKKSGHDVTILALLGGILDKTAKKNGIKLAPIQEPPSYKLGDGKWVMNTANGQVPSVDKTLYKVSDIKYDIIHVFSDELVSHLKRLYPEFSVVNTTFTDGLFVQATQNENSDKTIFMKTDIETVKAPEFIEKIMADYIEVL